MSDSPRRIPARRDDAPQAQTAIGTARGLALGGEAVFRLDNGQAVFVEGGAPGDRAELSGIATVRGAARSRIVQLLDPSPLRVTPPCTYVEAGCGGCQWQHLPYDEQVRQKEQILRDTLQRLGHLSGVSVLPSVAAAHPLHYRSVAQFIVDECGKLGFRRSHAHDVIPIQECLISHPLINRALDSLQAPLAEAILRDRSTGIEEIAIRIGTTSTEARALVIFWATTGVLRQSKRLAQLLAEACPFVQGVVRLNGTRHEPKVHRQLDVDVLMGEATLLQGIGRQQFAVGPRTFFQVNTEQAQALLEVVRRAVEETSARTVLDLFCGVGLFAVGVAELVDHVDGIEIAFEAVRLGRMTLAERGLSEKVSLHRGDALHPPPELIQGVDLVVIDPPRSGLSSELIEALSHGSPRWLVYVSCEPAHLARDLRLMVSRGWAVRWVQLVDMFPQTYHIETVTLLSQESTH
ncbi:MAG: 23S rRNA (uracil(1939)-C(5))-methyltransferase RlmD [Chloroflexi bacterium]|nr:23S rRNA (uracil(1939)-C(5))-methyltransferase RlmD [Chloroflexota bacterium]